MKKSEFKEKFKNEYEYVEKCSYCGNDITFFTQRDNDPEYYTNIWIECKCGEMKQCTLPVN